MSNIHFVGYKFAVLCMLLVNRLSKTSFTSLTLSSYFKLNDWNALDKIIQIVPLMQDWSRGR